MCSNANLDQELQLIQWARARGFQDLAAQLDPSRNRSRSPSDLAKSVKRQPKGAHHLCEIQLDISTRDDGFAEEGDTTHPKRMEGRRSSTLTASPQPNAVDSPLLAGSASHTGMQGVSKFHDYLAESSVRTLLESIQDLHRKQETFENRLTSWMARQSDCCERLEANISLLLNGQTRSKKATIVQETNFEGCMKLQPLEYAAMEKAQQQRRFPRTESTRSSRSLTPVETMKSEQTEKELPQEAQNAWLVFFEKFMGAVIILNSIQLGLAADFPDSPWKTVWLIFENFFTAVYTVEMLLMMAVHRVHYFTQGHLLFDFVVAIISILDAWILPLTGIDESVGFMQVFKLLRLLRVMRLFELQPELLALIRGLGSSLRDMSLVLVLACGVLYAVAVCSVEVLGSSDSGFPAYSDNDMRLHEDNGLDDFNNYMYFGTVYRSMCSIAGIVLLAEWSLTRPVCHVHPFFFPLFMAVVGLVTFGLLNVLIGIVVERVSEQTKEIDKQKEERHRKRLEEITLQLAAIFFEMDRDSSKHISLYELTKGVKKNSALRDILHQLPLPFEWTPAELLSMLDLDGSGWLSRDEFVTGMVRLIYCDDFQRDCVHAITTGMFHHHLRAMENELREGICKVIHEIHCAR